MQTKIVTASFQLNLIFLFRNGSDFLKLIVRYKFKPGDNFVGVIC